MRRTKQWWAILSKEERIELHWLEKHNSQWNLGGANIPDDCSECTSCSTPHAGIGLCPICTNRLTKLISKADQAMLAATAPKGGWLG